MTVDDIRKLAKRHHCEIRIKINELGTVET